MHNTLGNKKWPQFSLLVKKLIPLLAYNYFEDNKYAISVFYYHYTLI